MLKFPILYHKGKGGEIRVWSVWSDGDTVFTEYGVENGIMQISSKKVIAKNVGKKSATTVEEQADKEAKSQWEFKKKRKYSESVDAAEEVLQLPMLAKDYTPDKIVFPALMQPKLDGCFTYHASVTTDQGCLPIGKIVTEKLNVNALSYNENTQQFEFKKVINWFNNGVAPKDDWIDLKINNNRRLRCTKTHEFLTNNGWKLAEQLNENNDFIIGNEKSNRLIGMLLGTLLGDSCITTEKRHTATGCRLIFSHVNKEYFNFKCNILNIPGKISDFVSGYGSDELKFTSSVLDIPELNYFYNLDKNKENFGTRKFITQKILSNWLTREGLSLWISDDGSIRYNNGNLETPILSISTHNLSELEIKEVCSYFNSTWGVYPSAICDKRLFKPSWSIVFKSSDTVYLLSRLRNYGCKGVEYKFFFKPDSYIDIVKNNKILLPIKTTKCKNTMPIEKFDIEVEDNHNYVINGVVAHNCRSQAFWDGDRIKLISRAGLEWTVPTHIAEQVANVLPKGSQFDGELYVHGKSCQTITSYVKRLQPQTELVEYHIYDMPVVDGDDTLTNEERHAALTNILKDCQETHLILVETIEVHNEKEIKDAEAQWVSQGYEGGIVRNKKGVYRFGYRSWDLQKVKTFKDGEFEVVGCKEGVGKMVGCAIFECRNDITDATFDVTCSCPTIEKQEQYKNRHKYIGKLLTVKYFDRTDDGILRFPVGKLFRADEDLSKNLIPIKVSLNEVLMNATISKATVKPKDKIKKKSLFDTILEED